MKVEGLVFDIIFGPVTSRRYGVSLGVNLLPLNAKICSFDCVYCECGFTDSELSVNPDPSTFPSADQVCEALEGVLEKAKNDGKNIDAITLAGNGEPTLHPDFRETMRGIARARDRFAPNARIVALTNGTMIDQNNVLEGLLYADHRIVKLDTVDMDGMAHINRPLIEEDVTLHMEKLHRLPSLETQTMFIQGRYDNTRPVAVNMWMRRIAEVQPHAAQIYTIDRRPADPEVRPAPIERLGEIAEKLMRTTGVPAYVYS